MNFLIELIIGIVYLLIVLFFFLKFYVYFLGSDVNIFILYNDVIYLKILKMIGLVDEYCIN